MKRRAILMVTMVAPCLVAASGPQAIGQYGRWGAFRTAEGSACYAIAKPARSGKGDTAAITISSWPERQLFRQIHVRFRGEAENDATLTIADRRFPLVTRGADGWPASPQAGKQIIRLLRDAETLRVIARIHGRRITDTYAPAGAASAIDAADVACLRGR